MVFSVAGYATSTTVSKESDTLPTHYDGPIVDMQPVSESTRKLHDKSDWVQYTMLNAPFIGLAGVIGGAQEAYYKFEKMPPAISRRTWHQAVYLYSIVAKKTLLATALGAVFCATDALVEQARGQHDMVSGVAGGLVAGALFAAARPWPQPMAWPLAFAGLAASADILGEHVPQMLQGFRHYGPMRGREAWGDPVPPRPPILATGASARPTDPGHFWRENA